MPDIFHDGPFLPAPEPGPDKGNFLPKPTDKGNFFPVIRMTPNSLRLVDALVDAAAAFEVGLRAVSDEVPGAADACSERYGELTHAKKAVVEYMAALMDAVKSPELQKRRTKQVRYD